MSDFEKLIENFDNLKSGGSKLVFQWNGKQQLSKQFKAQQFGDILVQQYNNQHILIQNTKKKKKIKREAKM